MKRYLGIQGFRVLGLDFTYGIVDLFEKFMSFNGFRILKD